MILDKLLAFCTLNRSHVFFSTFFNKYTPLSMSTASEVLPALHVLQKDVFWVKLALLGIDSEKKKIILKLFEPALANCRHYPEFLDLQSKMAKLGVIEPLSMEDASSLTVLDWMLLLDRAFAKAMTYSTNSPDRVPASEATSLITRIHSIYDNYLAKKEKLTKKWAAFFGVLVIGAVIVALISAFKVLLNVHSPVAVFTAGLGVLLSSLFLAVSVGATFLKNTVESFFPDVRIPTFYVSTTMSNQVDTVKQLANQDITAFVKLAHIQRSRSMEEDPEWLALQSDLHKHSMFTTEYLSGLLDDSEVSNSVKILINDANKVSITSADS